MNPKVPTGLREIRGRPGKALPRDKWEQLRNYLRAHPGACAAAAKALGLSRNTVYRYWYHGSKQYPPIREMHHRATDQIRAELERDRAKLEREKIEAHAQLEAARKMAAGEIERAQMAEIARDAMADKHETKLAEMRMSRTAREAVAIQLETIRDLHAKTGTLREYLVERCGDKTALSKESLASLTRAISTLGQLTRTTVEAAHKAVELERLLAGDPTRHVRVTIESPAEGRREIEEALAAAQRAGLVTMDAEGRVSVPVDVSDES